MKPARRRIFLLCILLMLAPAVSVPMLGATQKKAVASAVSKQSSSKSSKDKSSRKKNAKKKKKKSSKNSSSSYKKLTRNYTDERLESVLLDIAEKTGYTLVYDSSDIDADKPVTFNFKKVSAISAVRKVVGKQYDVKAKKDQLTITHKPVQPVTYLANAQAPSHVVDDSLKTITSYEDTLFSIICKQFTRELKGEPSVAAPATRKGHYLMFTVGGGYSSLGYQFTKDAVSGDRVGRNLGGPGANLRLQYAYFFHENWGFSLGAGASYYSSFGKMNHMKSWKDQTDSDGERYEHQALTHDWTEVQRTLMVDVPLALQMQYPLKDNLRLYGSVGIKAGIPLYNTYALKSGSLQHQGYYDTWNLTLDMNGHDFYTETIGEDFSKSSRKLNMGRWSVAATADLGVLIPLSEQLDFMAGVYFNYTCNDVYKGQPTHEMAWMQPEKSGGYQHAFMQTEYAGEIGSEYIKDNTVRPWAAGITLGIRWHHKDKVKAPKKQYEVYEKCDTTFVLQQRADTVIKPQKESAKQISRLMKKAVIWFRVDETAPILEPADIIDRLAEVLVANPNQKVLVNGHASKEGNARRNRWLSDQRAKAVAKLLMEKGVDEKQITVQYFSSDIEYNAGDSVTHTIALDRRVEIIPVDE